MSCSRAIHFSFPDGTDHAKELPYVSFSISYVFITALDKSFMFVLRVRMA